jgi:hypothetical protein
MAKFDEFFTLINLHTLVDDQNFNIAVLREEAHKIITRFQPNIQELAAHALWTRILKTCFLTQPKREEIHDLIIKNHGLAFLERILKVMPADVPKFVPRKQKVLIRKGGSAAS